MFFFLLSVKFVGISFLLIRRWDAHLHKVSYRLLYTSIILENICTSIWKVSSERIQKVSVLIKMALIIDDAPALAGF